MSTSLNPYIQFDTNAREAMEFYQSVLGGKLDVMTFGQMGMEGEAADLVMHSYLGTDAGFELMGADTPPGMGMDVRTGARVTISISGDDESQLRGYFDGLSAGGEVSMPLEKQVWGDLFGQFTDKYGVGWLVNIGQSGQG